MIKVTLENGVIICGESDANQKTASGDMRFDQLQVGMRIDLDDCPQCMWQTIDTVEVV